MFRILKLVLLAAAANCAPATFLPLTPFAQPYYFITPQYQPLLKIEQSPAPLPKIASPKGQYVFLYPNAQQFPLVAVRQEDGGAPGFFEQINNWWSEFQSGLQNPSEEQSVEPKPEESETEKKIENMQPLLPASTMPLNMNKQRFYVLNSLPQFYAPLPAPAIGNPILAIQSLKARSALQSPDIQSPADPTFADTIPAESEKIEQDSKSVEEPAEQQPLPQIQLRSNIVEPLQRLEIEQPQVPVVDNEPVPEMAAQQLVARFLEETASSPENPEKPNDENDSNQLRAGEPLKDMTSTAIAKPTGIAISGKGGESFSGPVATSITGDNGNAQAAPAAIALSGFDDEETKM